MDALFHDNRAYKGCGVYTRLLARIVDANGLLEAQKAMHAATNHRKDCPQCMAMNTGSLFGKKEVVITDGGKLC